MEYPVSLTQAPRSRTTIDVFGGCNFTLSARENEFFYMEDLSSDHYPQITPRKPRRLHKALSDCGGIIAKDALCYVNNGVFYINDYPIDMGLTAGEKQLVSMGAWVIVLPDKKMVNTATHEVQAMEAQFLAAGTVSFTPCTLDGGALDTIVSDTAPEDTTKVWIDTTASPHAMKQYSDAAGDWVAVATPYTKIEAVGIGKGFDLYDGVQISGAASIPDLNAAHAIWGKGDDYLVVAALCPGVFQQQGGLQVSRKLPDMDFVIEHHNRLWGCKYGVSGGVTVNEIYASKLGDPKNFHCFMGIASDSQVFSCGSDGPFTGAAVLDSPLFFKENCLHRVYGDGYPFAMQVIACNGVQSGCGKSPAVVGDTLFYKSRSGVMAYDGGQSLCISRKLGFLPGSAVGGAWGDKYYLSMEDGLYVFDTAHTVWHREKPLAAQGFCCCDDVLFAATDAGIVSLNGGDEQVSFSAETGLIGALDPDSKYLSRLTVRLRMAPGAQLRIGLRYDSEDAVQTVASLTGRTVQSFSLPLRPRRCDHLRMVLQGSGDVQVLSITKTMESGGAL